jgi:hypothetical protein
MVFTVTWSNENIQSGEEQTDTFQKALLPNKWGEEAESAHGEEDDTMPLQNLFSDHGSQEHVAS